MAKIYLDTGKGKLTIDAETAHELVLLQRAEDVKIVHRVGDTAFTIKS